VVAVFLLIRRATLPPLELAVGAAQRIAQGDLSGPPLPASPDEVGQLNTAIDTMKASLAGVVGEVRLRSHEVAASMSEVAVGSGDLSRRTEQQAATLQSTATQVTGVSQSVQRIGRQLQEADQQARQAGAVASDGGTAVGKVTARMEEILHASRRIADINGVINGIAFQTNILALNAAVEAARAGEHGRGFAVVASEVRALAHKSAEAAREIAALIGDTTGKVEDGAADVQAAGRTIEDVVAAVQRVAQLVNDVTGELNQQTGGLGDIDHAMSALDAGTQQNAAMAEQSAAAAASIQSQAQQLVQAVERFRLPA
jgi:methyl-accepting chemotaxis protein